MTSQFQIINKILQTKDYSLISMNNLTEDHFFQYRAEFNFIKNHYEKFRVVPDRLTFLNTFSDFDVTDVTEPDAYLLEQLIKDPWRSISFFPTKKRFAVLHPDVPLAADVLTTLSFILPRHTWALAVLERAVWEHITARSALTHFRTKRAL